MNDIKKNMIDYNYSEEFYKAILLAKEKVKEKDYQVLETQDLIRSILEIGDTGLGYVLGRFKIIKSSVFEEIDKAILVDAKTVYELGDTDELNKFQIRNLEEENRTIKFNSPVEFMKEEISDKKLEIISDIDISKETVEILEKAYEFYNQEMDDDYFDTRHLFYSLAETKSANAYDLLAKLLYLKDRVLIDSPLWYPFRLSSYDYKDGKNKYKQERDKEIQNRPSNKLKNFNYSIIKEYSSDLTKKAEKGELPEVIGRDREIELIEITITRMSKNNVALLGKGGVGKTAIIEGLANKIAKKEIESLKDFKILEFKFDKFLNDHYFCMPEAIDRLISDMSKEKNLIIFIDEIHMLGKVKGFTDRLKPAMARANFRIIGATTIAEWNQYIASDTALTRRFEMIKVNVPDEKVLKEIIKDRAIQFENYHGLNFEDDVLEGSLTLAKRYLIKEQLPDSVLTLLDNTAARVRVKNNAPIKLYDEYNKKMKSLQNKKKKLEKERFNDDQVQKIEKEITDLQAKTDKKMYGQEKREYDLKVTLDDVKETLELKIDGEIDDFMLAKLKNDKAYENDILKNLYEELSENVIGQDEALSYISNAIIRAKKGLRDKSRPIASMFFAGPSGIGKTEAAKTISRVLYGSEDNLVRLDMGEYQQEHEVAKILGAAPGYVGYGQDSILFTAIQENPERIILFDEIEKAHPKINDIFLQLLDEGRLTNSQGETYDFTNCIIIFTSNLTLKKAKEFRGFGIVDEGQRIKEDKLDTINAIKKYFRPEFVNRFDNIIVFNELNEEAIYKITEKMLEVTKNMIYENHIDIDITDEAIMYIAEQAYSPEYGAREIRRKIKELLENEIVNLMIDDEIVEGSYVHVDVFENKLNFEYSKNG